MKSITKLAWVDLKITFRNPVALFFTLCFPLLMLFIFGELFGNEPSVLYGGRGAIDMSVPGYIATLILGVTAFMSLPLDVGQQRLAGVFRRLRATPVRPGMVLLVKIITNLVLASLGTLLLVGAAILAYQITLPSDGWSLAGGSVFVALSLYALGFALTGLVRSVNAVRAVCYAVFYPMMFLSGGLVPMDTMPRVVRDISNCLPLTYAVNLLQSIWFNTGWDWNAVFILLGFMVVGVVVSIRFFRWE